MEAQRAVIVVEGCIELVCPMDPAAIDDHDDLFAGFAEDRHHLMEILAELLGIKVRHDFIEDFRGAILDGPDDAESHPTCDATPGAIASPRLALEGFVAVDLALTQRACREAIALGAAPPAQPRKGKAPQDGFVFIEQNDLTLACSVLQGGEFDRAIGESSRGGIEPASGTAVA